MKAFWVGLKNETLCVDGFKSETSLGFCETPQRLVSGKRFRGCFGTHRYSIAARFCLDSYHLASSKDTSVQKKEKERERERERKKEREKRKHSIKLTRNVRRPFDLLQAL